MGSLLKISPRRLRAGQIALVFLALLLPSRAALAQLTYACGDDGANVGLHCYANQTGKYHPPFPSSPDLLWTFNHRG